LNFKAEIETLIQFYNLFISDLIAPFFGVFLALGIIINLIREYLKV